MGSSQESDDTPTCEQTDQTRSRPQKSQKQSKLDFDHFLLDRLFPEPTAAFSIRPPRLQVLQQDCVFALDTNALLAPYELGAGEAADIAAVYHRLGESNQLFVPARAAQEFARNKSFVLKRMYDSVYNLTSHLGKVESLDRLRCPMLEGRVAYTEFIEASKAMAEARKIYSQSLTKLMKDLTGWSWDDPISSLYATLFSGDRICSHDVPRDKVLERLEYQNVHKVPPGYKDGGKADEGIGDLLIWLTLLKLGSDYGKNVIFVCNEEKADWIERTQNTVLSVRAELTHEFHTKTGCHFGLLNFADFLAIAGAKPETVEQAKSSAEDSLGSNDQYIEVGAVLCDMMALIVPHENEKKPFGFDASPVNWKLFKNLHSSLHQLTSGRVWSLSESDVLQKLISCTSAITTVAFAMDTKDGPVELNRIRQLYSLFYRLAEEWQLLASKSPFA